MGKSKLNPVMNPTKLKTEVTALGDDGKKFKCFNGDKSCGLYIGTMISEFEKGKSTSKSATATAGTIKPSAKARGKRLVVEMENFPSYLKPVIKACLGAAKSKKQIVFAKPGEAEPDPDPEELLEEVDDDGAPPQQATTDKQTTTDKPTTTKPTPTAGELKNLLGEASGRYQEALTIADDLEVSQLHSQFARVQALTQQLKIKDAVDAVGELDAMARKVLERRDTEKTSDLSVVKNLTKEEKRAHDKQENEIRTAQLDLSQTKHDARLTDTAWQQVLDKQAAIKTEMDLLQHQLPERKKMMEGLKKIADDKMVIRSASKEKREQARQEVTRLEAKINEEEKRLAELSMQYMNSTESLRKGSQEEKDMLAGNVNKAESQQKLLEEQAKLSKIEMQGAQRQRTEATQKFTDLFKNKLEDKAKNDPSLDKLPEKITDAEKNADTAWKALADKQGEMEYFESLSQPGSIVDIDKVLADDEEVAKVLLKEADENLQRIQEALGKNPPPEQARDLALEQQKWTEEKDNANKRMAIVQRAKTKMTSPQLAQRRTGIRLLEEKFTEEHEKGAKIFQAVAKFDPDGIWQLVKTNPEAIKDPANQKVIQKLTKDKKFRAAWTALEKQSAKLVEQEDNLIALRKQIDQLVCDDVRQELKTGEQQAQKAEDDLGGLLGKRQDLIDQDPELQKAQTDQQNLEGTEERIVEKKMSDEALSVASENDAALARFREECFKSRTDPERIKTFDLVSHLSDDDFDAVYENNGKDFVSAMKEMAYKKDKDGKLTSEKDPAYNEKVAKLNKVYLELIEQDQILEDLGASEEERLKQLENVPRAMWPPKFRQEIKAYRDVQRAFGVEDESARKKAAEAKAQVKGLLDKFLEGVDKTDEKYGVWINFALDSVSVISDLTQAGGMKSDAIKVVKAVADALKVFMKAQEARKQKNKVGPTKDNKALDDTEWKLEMVKAIRTSVSALGQVGKAALSGASAGLSIASTTSSVVSGMAPILSAVVDGLETMEAALVFGQHLKGAIVENKLQNKVDEGEDETMKKAFRNQVKRRKQMVAKSGVHMASKGIQTGGSVIVTASVMSVKGAPGAVVGYGLRGAGKGLEMGNKLGWMIFDWKKAADAQKIMEQAAAGSYKAMQEIFAEHQKYATMYIAMKAKEGDMNCLKMCVSRGLDKGKLLDKATSEKVIRAQLLKAVEQKDKMQAFDESAPGRLWKAMGKAFKRKDEAEEEVVTEEEREKRKKDGLTGYSGVIPDSGQIDTWIIQADVILQKPEDQITAADVSLRQLLLDAANAAIEHLAALPNDTGVLVVPGWPGLQAVLTRLTDLSNKAKLLPEKATSTRPKPKKIEFDTVDQMLRRTR